jgi:hypothetical protein
MWIVFQSGFETKETSIQLRWRGGARLPGMMRREWRCKAIWNDEKRVEMQLDMWIVFQTGFERKETSIHLRWRGGARFLGMIRRGWKCSWRALGIVLLGSRHSPAVGSYWGALSYE